MVLIIDGQGNQCITTSPSMIQLSWVQSSITNSLYMQECAATQNVLFGRPQETDAQFAKPAKHLFAVNPHSMKKIKIKKNNKLHLLTAIHIFRSLSVWIPSTWQHVQGDTGGISDASISSVDTSHDMCCTHAYLAGEMTWMALVPPCSILLLFSQFTVGRQAWQG